jgi:hypothetical protein
VNVDLIALLAIQVLHAIASLALISVGLTVGMMRFINPAHGAVWATRRPLLIKPNRLFEEEVASSDCLKHAIDQKIVGPQRKGFVAAYPCSDHCCRCLHTKRSRNGSEARILAAILADIGRRPLRAVIGRGTVIIGEGAGQGTRPVIVDVADVVGEPMKAAMVVDPRLRQARCYGQGGQDYGGGELRVGHLDSPARPEIKTF